MQLAVGKRQKLKSTTKSLAVGPRFGLMTNVARTSINVGDQIYKRVIAIVVV